MRESSVWSLSLGRWGGIAVRLHTSFLVFFVLTLFLSTDGQHDLLGYGLLGLVLLLVSVGLHELGHVWTALQLGGRVDDVILSPVGGLRFPSVPANHACQLLTAVAGPLVNLTLVVLASLPILWFDGALPWVGLLNPIAPQGILLGGFGWVALKMMFWINWLLLLINFLPAPPLDGARLLRAMLAPAVGYRRSVFCVALVAQLTAVALLATAFFLRKNNIELGVAGGETIDKLTIPTWAPLVLLSMVLFLSARLEIEKLHRRFVGDDLAGMELGAGFEPIDAPPPQPGPMQRWLEHRREQRQRQKQLVEEEEDWRVDDILARMHEYGPHILSPEDRAILERASARYRSRMQRES